MTMSSHVLDASDGGGLAAAEVEFGDEVAEGEVGVVPQSSSTL